MMKRVELETYEDQRRRRCIEKNGDNVRCTAVERADELAVPEAGRHGCDGLLLCGVWGSPDEAWGRVRGFRSCLEFKAGRRVPLCMIGVVCIAPASVRQCGQVSALRRPASSPSTLRTGDQHSEYLPISHPRN